MAADMNSVDKKVLKSLDPFESLSIDILDELAAKSTIEDIPVGRVLFRQGEKDKRLIYVLSGQVEVTATGKAKGNLIKAKTEEARHPIAYTLPRPGTAKTKTSCKLLFVDGDLLEFLTQEDNSGLIEVDELGTDDEGAWMLRFLQSRAFLKLPTENIQTLLMKLEEVPVKKGDIIVQQGDKNNYYYIIRNGRCAVTRRPAPKAKDVQIAILKAGDGFGEEALITGGSRNASISMLEDGMLMRLGKKDFMS
ncbi:MAG: cyclic nucleotide-binding domain-containing protein, partial [Halobacteria archaeon]|nr:cyclic nucleotide-binding domain-containing protein [Halobacteria archaeon]